MRKSRPLPFPAARHRRRHPSAVGAAIAGLLFAGAAQAQSQTADGPSMLPSVTVTANKIEQESRSVPQSITVIDGAVLEEKGIKKISDLIDEIPNMYSNGTGGQGLGVSFRGLNASMFTNNNPVVIYVDGVYYAGRYDFDPSFANVERIEVLRGPQGSLYGKDAIGAVINIVTKKPENDWHGSAGAEFAQDNTRFGTFNASGALAKDTLYAGINAQASGDDGWIENTWPGMSSDASAKHDAKFGGFLLYTPNAALDAKLSVTHDQYTTRWWDAQAAPGGTPIDAFSRDTAEHASFDVPTKETGDTDAQSLLLTYRMGGATLDSVTAHKTFDMDGVYDADFGADPLYAGLTQFNHSRTETWSEELRLASSATTGLRWVAGLYLEKEKHNQGPYGMQFPNYDTSSMTFLGNFEMDAESATDTRTGALFGQLIYPLGAAELTLGGRWQTIEKKFDIDTYYVPVGTTGTAMYSLADKTRWNAFLPKAALSYALSNAWSAYASYAKGYMAGGYNYFSSGGSAQDNRFEPQVSNNYEIGIKGGAGNFTLAANLFYMDIKDIHIYKSQGAIYTTSNANKAHAQGAELELTWLPARGWELGGALGVIDAKYDDYDAGTHKYDGKAIENTPSRTLRLSAAYLAAGGGYARVDVRNFGRVFFYDDAAQGFAREGDYTVVDLKAGWRFADWDLYAFVQNLTDEEYVSGFMSKSTLSMAYFGAPRKVGIGARYRF